MTVIEFKAQWCGPCRNMQPLFEEVAGEYEDIDTEVVDIDEDTQRAKEAGISTVPSFLAVQDGEVVERRTGTHTREELRELFDQLGDN